MDLNSHEEIHATEDQVSSQLPNVTKDTHQAPDESLEWPEEVFKSLNFPTPGLQEMTVSSMSYPRINEVLSADSTRLRRSLQMTIP